MVIDGGHLKKKNFNAKQMKRVIFDKKFPKWNSFRERKKNMNMQRKKRKRKKKLQKLIFI